MNTHIFVRLFLTLLLLAATVRADSTTATNDAFASRLLLQGATNTVNSSNVGATKEPGEPNHARDTGGTSLWWAWTAPANGPVTINTTGSDFDTLLAIYTGTNITTLILTAQDDDFDRLRTSQVRFNAVAGTEYEIAVDGWQGSSGNIVLNVNQPTPVPPTILTQPTSQTNAINMAVTFNVVASGVLPFHYQWFKDGSALSRLTRSDSFTINHVQTNDAGIYTVLVSDRFGSVLSSNAVLTVIPPPPPPLNDSFTNRIALTGATNSLTATNNYATRELGEPRHAHEPGHSSVWWSWIAPANGAVTINTIGSTFDTLLGVYTGTNVAALTLVAADDDSGGNNTSLVTFNATAGTEYEIAVDGWDGSVGTLTLNVLQPTPSPLAPTITAQPQSLKIILTNDLSPVAASFSVTSTNATTYQWRKNNALLTGATNQTFTLTNALPTDSGYYSVIVANDYGSLLSSNALLSVRTPRYFHSPVHFGDGRFQLQYDSQPGDLPGVAAPLFDILATTNFVNWVTLTNGWTLTNGQIQILDANSTNHPHRFYRIRER